MTKSEVDQPVGAVLAVIRPKEWLRWIGGATAVWACPGCMAAIWGGCYAERYGVPGPYYPWSVRAMDVLFGLNLLALALFLFLSRKQPALLALGLLLALVELAVTFWTWRIGGASVSGFFL